MTKVFITGASGFLGRIVAEKLESRHQITAGYHRNRPGLSNCREMAVDVCDSHSVEAALEDVRPALVMHSAAISQPDECEKAPDLAWKVLVEGSQHVARACARIGARLLHISTDLVFDGRAGFYREEDPVEGISVYSRAKIEAERLVHQVLPQSVILRVALLYGPPNPIHPGQLDKMMENWSRGRPMTFFVDQFRTPAFAPQVAEAVEAILARPEIHGVFHLGGADRVSRYEFARLVADIVRAPQELVRRGSMFDFPGPAVRGPDCSLVSARIQGAIGIHPMPCRRGLLQLQEEGFLKPVNAT